MNMFIIPILGGFIGWVVVHFAFGMIYYRKNQIFRRLSALLKGEILTESFMQKILEDQEITPILEHQFEECMEKSLAAIRGKFPMLGMVMQGSMMDQFKTLAKDEFMQMLPEFKSEMVTMIIPRDKIAALLSQKLQEMDNKIWKQAFHSSLRGIAEMGAIIGFLIGGIQSVWYSFM